MWSLRTTCVRTVPSRRRRLKAPTLVTDTSRSGNYNCSAAPSSSPDSHFRGVGVGVGVVRSRRKVSRTVKPRDDPLTSGVCARDDRPFQLDSRSHSAPAPEESLSYYPPNRTQTRRRRRGDENGVKPEVESSLTQLRDTPETTPGLLRGQRDSDFS